MLPLQNELVLPLAVVAAELVAFLGSHLADPEVQWLPESTFVDLAAVVVCFGE